MAKLSIIIVAIAALLCACLIPSTHAMGQIPEDLKDILVVLTDSNADLLEQGTWFVDLYAPWCAYCKQVFPTIVEFAHFVKKNPEVYPETRVALIDGTTNPKLNTKFIVSGYPSLSIYKDTFRSVYRGTRTLDGISKQVKIMSQPSVSLLSGRGQLKRAQGTNGNWENLFIYIGLNLKTHTEFIQCADKFQSQARFYSPWGYTDQQSRALAQSIWHNFEGDYDKQFELVSSEQNKAFHELLDHFKLKITDLPVVINQPVGRAPYIFDNGWGLNQDEGFCLWVENLIQQPIQQLIPGNFDQIINKSDVYLLMSVKDQTVEKMSQLSLLPLLSERFASYFDYFVWTHGSTIPQFKQKHVIPSNQDDFVVVVNRDLKRYWVTYDLKEEPLLQWMQDIRTGADQGLSLYHWADFITPLSRDVMKYTERFSADHLIFFLILGCGTFLFGGIIGLIYICYCMEDVQVKIDRIKKERLALQEKLDEHQQQPELQNSANTSTSKVHQDQQVQRRK